MKSDLAAGTTALKAGTTTKDFHKYALGIILATFIAHFLQPVLTNDIMNVFFTYLPDMYGWTHTQIAMALTIGSYVSIPCSFMLATAVIRFDPKKISSGCIVLSGLCVIIMARTSDLTLFYIAYVVNYQCAKGMVLGGLACCTNWFISKRGRVLGIVTMACPLASAVYTNVLVRAIEASGSFPLAYGIWGIMVLALGIITYPMLNRFPETFGLQPDGIHRSDEELAAMTQAAETAGGWPLKRLFTTPETYLLMIGWACIFWVMTGFMSLFVPRMLELGVPIFTAVNYLTMASILGIFLSYGWGWIDDRYGAPKASVGLACGYLLMSLAMWFASSGNQVLVIIAAIGLACATGGLPNLNPSSIAFVYGRNDFMPNLRWIMLVAGGLSAPAVVIFGMIKDKYGKFDSVYLLCSILGVIAILCFALIRRSYDPDRKTLS